MKKLILFLIISFLTGCNSLKVRPVDATSSTTIISMPKARVTKTITSFTSSLICMDNLFSRYQIKDNVIGLENFLNKTTNPISNRKDLLISAISKMSSKSKAFVVSSFDADQLNTMLQYQQKIKQSGQAQNIIIPNFFIKGAYFIDKSIINEKTDLGGNANIKRVFTGFGQSKDKTASIISMDLNMGELTGFTFIPGLSASNSIAVVRHGKAVNLDAGIEKFGINYEVSLNHNEGQNKAIRTLVELSLIELLGKSVKVPYWECLDVESSNPEINHEIEQWYLSLKPIELIKYVQKQLTHLKLFSGSINGIEDQALKTAIIQFKQKNHLLVDSFISFELYKKLMLKSGLKQDQQIKQTHIIPLDFKMKTDQLVYHTGDTVELFLSLSTDAYVHCFYQDAKKQIFKIFPNRFSTNGYLKAGEFTPIIGKNGFSIKAADKNATEKMLCFTASTDLNQVFAAKKPLYNELVIKNLEPISVDNLKQLIQVYNQFSTIKPLSKIINIQIQ